MPLASFCMRVYSVGRIPAILAASACEDRRSCFCVLPESGGVEDVPELLLQPRRGAAAVEDVHELMLA